MHLKRVMGIVLVSIALALFCSPAAADLSTVPPGGSVFTGEQGLDISAGLGMATQIAWWQPGSDPSDEIPDDILTVGDPFDFSIDPAIFATETGTWYQWIGSTRGAAVFIVKTPEANIRVWDLTAGTNDVSSALYGDLLDFRVDTNLFLIQQRDMEEPMDFVIKVKAPAGNVLTLLYTPEGIRQLYDLPVGTNPWFWSTFTGAGQDPDSAWLTNAVDSQDNPVYDLGTYTIWTTCGENELAFAGPSKNLNLNMETLEIEIADPTLTRGNKTFVTVTGRPDTLYYLWVKQCPTTMTGYPCDQPPMFNFPQSWVFFDPVEGPYRIGSFVFDCLTCNKTIKESVPPFPDNGVHYYSQILTDPLLNNRTVEIQTTTDTEPGTYIIRVEGIGLDGDHIFAEAQLTVNKGPITMETWAYDVPITQTYLGEIIKINGTNRDSRTTYLFVTGPCQPKCGGNLTSPETAVIDGVPSTFTQAAVKGDGSWEFEWDTRNLKIDTGEYTIYASSKPDDRAHLENTPCYNCSEPISPSCAAWVKKNLTLLRPQLTANITPQTVTIECCNSPAITVSGKATGNPAKQLSLWIFGQNKIVDKKYIHHLIPVQCDDTFSYVITKDFDIRKVDTGTYTVLLQHPMFNHKFDILVENEQTDVPTPLEWNRLFVVSSSPVKWSKLFPIDGTDRFVGFQALGALIEGFADPNIDDEYLILNFTVSNQNITPTPTTTTPTPVTPDTIHLLSGWNFVSTPKTLSPGQDTAIAVFGQVDLRNRPILNFNASNQAWEQMLAASIVKPLDGLWVFSGGSKDVPLHFNVPNGSIPLPPTKQLYTGWNSYGFSDTTPASARGTLLSVKDGWVNTFGFDAATQSYETSLINGETTGPHSDSNPLFPTKGYWVYMTKGGILNALSG